MMKKEKLTQITADLSELERIFLNVSRNRLGDNYGIQELFHQYLPAILDIYTLLRTLYTLAREVVNILTHSFCNWRIGNADSWNEVPIYDDIMVGHYDRNSLPT